MKWNTANILPVILYCRFLRQARIINACGYKNVSHSAVIRPSDPASYPSFVLDSTHPIDSMRQPTQGLCISKNWPVLKTKKIEKCLQQFYTNLIATIRHQLKKQYYNIITCIILRKDFENNTARTLTASIGRHRLQMNLDRGHNIMAAKSVATGQLWR